MLKKMLAFTILLMTFFVSEAQLKSPEEFLGYKIGSRYTPHWKIVNYFNHVAANGSSGMKLQSYGETNEGRPLLLAFVSSAENISNLENIRKNNLHGNEASSSEAAMMTLYALVDPSDTKTKEWLKNTVVIIDPCINPDGRDRYVNWYNSAVGKKFNPQPMAREHREPWPQGRTNHYNFDLNRDWAWQTQIESQQRIKMYDQWMPQVHVDYHEQGVNEPYYFAPAAEPFHEVITPWQREFQTSIGKNNAKYFDQNNWLYFTKEVFDLFYPSYGDTYPLYNGSIGMTYEQAGIAAGLGVTTDEADTLTLGDRAMHHFTTSMSTVEISSLNANRLIKEFRKYFNNAISTGYGEYKSYVIKNQPQDAQRIDQLLGLLDKNGIQYGLGSGSAKGYNYITGREETFLVAGNDIVISSYQPRSALVNVLFEPRSRLSDSVTYDITAWSLPYVYGLTAWASKDKIAGGGNVARTKALNKETAYGYVMPWNGVRTVKAVGQLLQKGILLRYAEEPFEINGNRFGRGTVIVLKTANKAAGSNLFATVRQVADACNVQLYPVTGGMVEKGFDFGSDKVHPMKAPKVVLVTGDAIGTTAAGSIWYFFEQEIDYPVTQVNVTDLERLNWNEVDVLIMPDGNYRFLNDKEDLETFKSWINKGGRVIAMENAVAQLAKTDWGLKAKKADEADKKDDDSTYSALKIYEARERGAVSGTTPGSIWKVTLDNTHPLAFGYPEYYFTLKQDDNIYEFMKDGWNVGVIKKENQVAGFVGSVLQSKLKDGLLFGVQSMGNGSITYLADNVMFRSFWENGKLMFCNALFLVGQ
jgi:hypothetical protein